MTGTVRGENKIWIFSKDVFFPRFYLNTSARMCSVPTDIDQMAAIDPVIPSLPTPSLSVSRRTLKVIKLSGADLERVNFIPEQAYTVQMPPVQQQMSSPDEHQRDIHPLEAPSNRSTEN
jgi:hypothetical protein